MNLSFPIRTQQTRTPALIIGAILAAAGCSSSSAPKTGSLDVTVVAPAGLTGNVTVTGPNSYSKSVTASTTLTGLAPGSYTVTAAPVATPDPIVGTFEMAAVSGSPVAVTAGKATDTATVTYTPRVGSGGLWVAGFAGAGGLSDVSAAQLAAGTSSAASVAIGTPARELAGVAFDATGNLWVAKFDTDTIEEYAAASLAASGTPAPSVVLVASALLSPSAIAFDANGNLWVVGTAHSVVGELAASQLTSSGSVTPTVVISANGGSLNVPLGMAFDANGNMWVVSDGALVEYTPSQLAATSSPVPAVTIGDDGSNSLNQPLALAVDASGGVWVSNGDSPPFSVVGYGASQLTASGTPTPHVVLTPNGSSLVNPAGLAFDASGNLWVANVVGASPVVEFSTTQIATSGSPAPTITVTSSSIIGPWGLAFNPHASGLPIKP